ncbi:TIGR04066 family peptide maturation system protein [Anaerosacchariphilus polymeriproducens]|uniref:TIGR04066 family peptide maturation system protein n=1 Tax=Anaerosacchariphilus polymeriproducens TaxID=1812858 RepID=UPI0013900344|nr:TIGR04066 family peptide maturation system protein [Anaerosacchariphilus polymeriproducens]
MKNLVVYPYNHDVEILLKYKEWLMDYHITGAVSFKEHSLIMEKLQKKHKFMESQNLKSVLDFAQILYLCDPMGEYISEQYSFAIEEAVKNKKEILLSRALFNKLNDQLLKKNRLRPECILKNDYIMKNVYNTNRLLELPIPVIAIAGLGEKCSKFETQILVNQVVSEMGYRPLTFSTNILGSLFGMYSLPDMLFGKEFSYQEKIIQFNHYVYDICKSQNPDVIIIGYPSGVMPLGEHYYNYFGEIPSIMSYAVPSDIGILNLYYAENMEEEYLKNLQNYCMQKYSFPVEAFCVAAQRVEYSPADKVFEFYFLGDEFLEKHYPQIDQNSLRMINITDICGAKQVIESLIQLLEQNVNSL